MANHPNRKYQINVIADNGGGITLQCPSRKYSHHYDDAAQVVNDLRDVLSGGDVANWDGNEWDEHGLIEYDYNVERNGGYQWYCGTAKQILDELQSIDIDDCSWHNVLDLATAARQK